jgi:hypothetical protein
MPARRRERNRRQNIEIDKRWPRGMEWLLTKAVLSYHPDPVFQKLKEMALNRDDIWLMIAAGVILAFSLGAACYIYTPN